MVLCSECNHLEIGVLQRCPFDGADRSPKTEKEKERVCKWYKPRNLTQYSKDGVMKEIW